MLSQDAEAFEVVMKDLCLAFNRPWSPELTGVFWEALRYAPIHEVRRIALKYRNTGKKFPTPHDLTPPRATAPEPKRDEGPSMSSWAIAANKILFSVAYQGHRGFKPIGDALPKCLARKTEYVRMAEDAAATGDVWDEQEFNRFCREGFQKLLSA
jgi:hypothetical protein